VAVTAPNPDSIRPNNHRVGSDVSTVTVQSRASQAQERRLEPDPPASAAARAHGWPLCGSPASISPRTAAPAAASADWSAERSAVCRVAIAPIQIRAQAAVLEASRTIATAQMVADPTSPRGRVHREGRGRRATAETASLCSGEFGRDILARSLM
jgi:hypothetical protein